MAKAKPAENEGVDFGEGQEGALVVDLSAVEDDSGFEAIPRGMYPCVIDNLEYAISQAKGNPMWTWTLEIEDGEYAGRKLFYHTVFKGPGLPITKKAIAAVMPDLLSAPFDPEAIANSGEKIGLRLKVRVDQKMYEGEKRNNVKGVFAADEAGGDGF